MGMGVTVTRACIERELARLRDAYGAQAIYLFGSWARGEESPESDIDVLVDGGEGFTPSDVFAIAEELYLAFGRRVDVYEKNEIDAGTPFEREILQDRLLVA